jgi:hypothetical protein
MEESKVKKERTVIHLHILKSDIHEYFGSVASVFEYHTAEELGISYASLRNFVISIDKPYSNSKCVIRKGILKQKSGGRGIKS